MKLLSKSPLRENRTAGSVGSGVGNSTADPTTAKQLTPALYYFSHTPMLSDAIIRIQNKMLMIGHDGIAGN
ncbi:MAG: hypothetical protein P8X74_18995, partial [Reinekea sp.]